VEQPAVSPRKDAKLTQVTLAKKLRRPQSFVSDGERLDLIEFLEVPSAMRTDERMAEVVQTGEAIRHARRRQSCR
jgi:hypothetical protein